MGLNEENIKTLAFLLEEKRRRERKEEQIRKYEKVKDILIYLAFFGTCVFAPKAIEVFKPLIMRTRQYYNWKKFNKEYLKRSLHRLAKQKIVEIENKGLEETVNITDKGKRKILKYALEDLEITKPKRWEGKWYLVTYDITNKKRILAERIRKNLLGLGFVALQKSVYIFPFSCEKEVEILRTHYGLEKEIKLFITSQIEDEEAYKEYFGLKVV